MRSRGYAVTYAGESCGCNKENYFLNGICKEDLEGMSCCTSNKDVRSRNLYALSSGVKSAIAGMDLAYIAVDVLKSFFGEDFVRENNEYFSIANNAITSHVFESGNASFDVDSSVVYIADDVATVYNIGDTPVFFFQKGEMKKVSGKVPETVEVQKSSYDDYGILRVKNIEKATAKCLGVLDDSQEIVPYVSESIPLKGESFFVICSESLLEAVGEKIIKNILANKSIKECDKAVSIVNSAVEKNPEGNYTAVVVAVSRGMAVAQAELKSFYRWLAVTVACSLFCLFGEGFVLGIGNAVKSIQSFVDRYTMGEDDDIEVPIYVPKEEPEEEKTESGKEPATEEAETSGTQQPESNNASQAVQGSRAPVIYPSAPAVNAATPQRVDTSAPQKTTPPAETPSSSVVDDSALEQSGTNANPGGNGESQSETTLDSQLPFDPN